MLDQRVGSQLSPAGGAAADTGSTDSSAPARAPAVSGYEIRRRVARGGQGEVWEARRLRDQQRVALKVLLVADEAAHARARFDASFNALQILNHPNVVRVLDRGVLPDGRPWQAHEYVTGWTLTEYVERLDAANLRTARGGRARFPHRTVLELFTHVCEGVEAAHRVGIIHRDLKPNNILVDANGRPRIVDFGLARTQESARAALTLTGYFVGSPAWSAPEQVDGISELVDVRTDVYALGLVLYNLLTGTFPYDVSGSLTHTLGQIVGADPVSPRRHARFVDHDLEAILLRTLAKRPAARYQSVTELREDLQRYLLGTPVRARQQRLLYVAGKFARRHKLTTTLVTTAVLLSVAYGAWITALHRRATAAEQTARAAAKAAEHRYVIARDTAEYLLSAVDTDLRDVAGADAVRRDLLTRSYARLRELFEAAPEDPRLRADHAGWLLRLSEIAMQLGNLDEALSLREQARSHFTALQQLTPDAPDVLNGVALSTILVGDIAKERAEYRKAEALYAAALAIHERLAWLFPDDPHLLGQLGYSLQRVAAPPVSSRPPEARLALLERRQALCQQLWERAPQDVWNRFALATAHSDLFEFYHVVRDEPPLAERHREAAARLFDGLVAEQPQNAHFRYYRAWFKRSSLGLTEFFEGEMRADAALALALADANSLVARAPERVEYHRLLWTCKSAITQRQNARGNWPGAADALCDAISEQHWMLDHGAQHQELLIMSREIILNLQALAQGLAAEDLLTTAARTELLGYANEAAIVAERGVDEDERAWPLERLAAIRAGLERQGGAGGLAAE